MDSFENWYCATKKDLRKMVYNASKPYYDTLHTMPNVEPVKDM
jgi:hypothetical protein